MKIAFYAGVSDPILLDRVLFYRNDIRALRDLGHEVDVTNRLSTLSRVSDIYFVWWWTRAMLPSILAAARKKPFIITGVFNLSAPITDPKASAYFENRPIWQRMLVEGALKRADANIFLSQYEYNTVRATFGIETGWYIPCGVDLQRYCPDPVMREEFLLNIAWSGKHNVQRKCLLEIIEAFALLANRYPRMVLKMAGTPGDGHESLVACARRCGVEDRVQFLGAISEEEKIALFRRCRVYVQPSLFEGFGLAIAEAMACGAPVVCSPVGSIPEVVGDAGLMVAGDDPRAIAETIERLCEDRMLRAELSAQGYDRIASVFSLERRKEGLARVIDAVV